MNRIQATGIEAQKQLINPITHSSTQMDATPIRKELMNFVDQQPADVYEREYIDFIDLAAHELDAPLRKLSLLTGRLTDKFEAAGQNKDLSTYIDRINNCVHDMQATVESLSVLSKITSEKSEYESCNLDAILRKVLEELKIRIETQKAVIEILSPLPEIEGNAAQLALLFKHIIENAIKFRKENVLTEVNIQTSLAGADEKEQIKLSGDRVYYEIEITDNGIGFNNDCAEKIFRPFVRLNGKSRFPGSGVGLAICKKIVDHHQGVIYADSKEDQGTRFVLLLPQTH
jgi:signal transduction histidine kinase